MKSYKKRLLVFIVAYNAENTIETVLKRIPASLSDLYEVEILIIDDSSQDATFARSELAKKSGTIPFKTTVLFNPVNQGYGGNQKIGFHYAILNSFDWVALVHGDGQYAPECLPELTKVLADNQAEAVFGSRMMEENAALKGGMPLYKFIGNKILTRFQNITLGSSLSEFHSGYRLYSISALKKIPFDLNSNDFHFDTEIIIQLLLSNQRIKELPIPTFYGDEICHVNGIKYAWNVFRTTIQARLQKYHIFYDRKFDCVNEEQDETKFIRYSAEAFFADKLSNGENILIIGYVSPQMLSYLKNGGHKVEVHNSSSIMEVKIEKILDFQYIAVLDDADLAQRPDLLIKRIRNIIRLHPDIKLVLAVGNIGFILTRLLLLMGRFSYTKKGIISLAKFKLFTLRTLEKLLNQNSFETQEVQAIPIPYQMFFGSGLISTICARIHLLFGRLRPSLFAYQFLIVAKPKPSLDYLLKTAIQVAAQKQSEIG